MMNCEEVRLQIGADPSATAPSLEAHVAGCADCAGYRHEMRRLDDDLRRAMGGLPVAAGTGVGAGVGAAPPDPPVFGSNVVPLRPASAGAPGSAPASARADAYSAPLPTARRWALAASVLLVGVLAASFFALQPRDALASAVVDHLSKEPDSWSKIQPIPRSALELVLARSGVRLDQVESGSVVYANSCFLRGRHMPHLVVSTPTGPVTVIVLRGESVPERVEFEEGRYAGVLLPVPGGGGGIAVLTRGGTGTGEAAGGRPDVEAAAARVLAALRFDGEAPPAQP
jgi:hypothetical protein